MTPVPPVRRPLDQRGQMPFTMLAVLLVLLGGSSATIIGMIQDSSGATEEAGEDLEAMQEVFTAVQGLVEDGAMDIMAELSSRHTDDDLEPLQDAFQQAMRQWVDHYFPLRVGAFHVSMSEADLAIDLRHLSTLEDGEYSGSLPMFPMVTGSYKVRVSSDRGGMERSLDMERSGISPLPFLMERMQNMALDMEGSRSQFVQLVSQQLSALAQTRALQGYGVASMSGPRGSRALITTIDVHQATDNALAILEAANFRDVDSADPSLRSMASSSEVDPATLMLQRSWNGSMNLSSVLSQTLASLVDSLVLQWLDYLHVVDLANLYEAVNDGVNDFIDDVMCMIGGPECSPAARYVKEMMAAAGHTEYEYRYLYQTAGSFIVQVPAMQSQFVHVPGSETMTLPGCTLALSLPMVDIFQWPGWEGFTAEYRRQTEELVQYLRSFVFGVCDSLASSYGLGSIDVDLDPFSGRSLAETLVQELGKALLDDREWMRQVIGSAIEASRTLDHMSESLGDFVQANWQSMYSWVGSFDQAFRAVQDHYRVLMMSQYSHLYDLAGWQWEEELMSILNGNGVLDQVSGQARQSAWSRAEMMIETLSTVAGSSNPLQGAIVQLARWGAGTLPALDELVLQQMGLLLQGMTSANSLQGGNGLVDLPGSSHFLLYDPEGRAFLQALEVRRESDLHVNILGFAERERNTHHTGFEHVAFSPYSCVLEIELTGSVRHTLSSLNDSMSAWSVPASQSHDSVVSSTLEIPVLSAWPLQGVDYRPSNTLGGDVGRVLLGFADHLLSPLTQAFRAADGVFDSLGGLMKEVNGYATQAMTALSDAILTPLVQLQDLLGEGAEAALRLLADMVMNMGTLNFSIDIHGLELRFDTNLLDMAVSMSRNILKVTLGGSVGDTIFSVSLRLMQAPSKSIQTIISANMATDQWAATLVIDPFMKIYRHFAEIRGHMGGHGFEIFLPQVTQYQTFRVALSQMAGIGTMLSNIPLPMPGMKGSIDAGFDIKYNLPLSGNVVINEVEKNPLGPDTGHEWVELYNPLGSSVDLSGWYISSGQTGRVHHIGDVQITAGGRLLVRFPGQFLNNGGGTNIPQGECAKLWDAQGRLMDSSPWRSDYYNDHRTWQREFDGSDRWVFKDGTPGLANGKASVSLSTQDWLRKQISDAFLQAFAEYGNNIQDLDGIITVLKRTVAITASRIVDTVSEALVESSFFLRIGVSDISSSAHGGVEMSVLVTPDFIREGLQWIFDSMARMVMNVGNPVELVQPSFLTEHVHIRLAVFTAAGPPKFMTLLEEGMTVELQAMVQCNLASLAGVLGLPAGNASMGFGVVLRGVPGAALPSIFNVDADKQADIWLLRGHIDFASNAL